MEVNIVKLVTDYGLAISIAIIFLYLAYKSFSDQNDLIKKQFEENMEFQKAYQKEVIETMVLIKDKIVNGHLNSDDLKIQIRLHWLKMVNIYKSNVFKYIIQNNLKKNIGQIEIELDKIILDMINRSAELLRNQATPYNFLNAMDLLKIEMKNMHSTAIEILNSNLDCGELMCVDYKELARIMENHINHFESETIIKINELKL